MTDAKGDEYLTPAQAAAVLHVSPKTVTRWATMGHLRCVVTLGGHRRFRRGDVEEILGHMAGTTRHPGSAQPD
jgi:excisionase family DNA binding protein